MHLLKEAGIVAVLFAAEDLFDLKLREIEHTEQSLFTLLTPLVGEAKRSQEQSARSKPITIAGYALGTNRNVIALGVRH
ncbi:hypothetical protein ON010_g19171 [Phytophthora cinnamomi]|nr:hypothetical protein ON010_g19171 [Phytophthora cinnamomi]